MSHCTDEAGTSLTWDSCWESLPYWPFGLSCASRACRPSHSPHPIGIQWSRSLKQSASSPFLSYLPSKSLSFHTTRTSWLLSGRLPLTAVWPQASYLTFLNQTSSTAQELKLPGFTQYLTQRKQPVNDNGYCYCLFFGLTSSSTS